MGYTTDFEGQFAFNKELDNDTYKLLNDLASTRRMIRKVRKSDGYGIDGELYAKDEQWAVMRYNDPPRSQPSLWLQWRPTPDKMHLAWDGGEKFYGYVEWLEFLLTKVLKPAGYSLTGKVTWQGDIKADKGTITCTTEDGIHVKGGKHSSCRAYYRQCFGPTCFIHGSAIDANTACRACENARKDRQMYIDLDAYYEGTEDEAARARLDVVSPY